jgi:photosystem II stability/assembly factor-like uncharacterized protein
MSFRAVLRMVVVLVGLGVMAAQMRAATWFPLGPYGGDARAIVADPRNSSHLFMGTATGWVFESIDGGNTWARLAQIGKRNDLMIDRILTDPTKPQRLLVGAWIVDHPDGGLFISDDGGKSWYDQAEMHGQSVRSLARSLSDPNILVAGTLTGVFRSMDDGDHWKQISPQGSSEIHEIQSVAIDPANPLIIYAGTWHLPWKTTDGGKTWFSIKNGLIVDSDVFSIIVDPNRANVVYLSACSGIYKSLNAGKDFIGGVTYNKAQGIPVEARRTRRLMQDPNHPETVYGGTTQGLYRTQDGGASWLRLTSSDVIVNDVYIDPKDSNHVMLATDRGGVLNSHDAGASFVATDTGFSARQVDAFAADLHNMGSMFVGVVNDKEFGGVFRSTDGGSRWQQVSVGLDGSDVFSLGMAGDGTLLAGTGHGVFRMQDGLWAESNDLMPPPPPPAPPAKPLAHRPGMHTAAASARKPAAPKMQKLDAVVYSIVRSGDVVYAGTSEGVEHSEDNGKTWADVSSLKQPETHYLAVQGKIVMAAGLKRMSLSVDDGATWDAVPLPADLTQINAIAADSLSHMWVGGREGVWYSTDSGVTWKTPERLLINDVSGIFFDGESHRILVTTSNSSYVFSASVPDYDVKFFDTGWKLRFVRPVGDHLVGATLFDGMVVQPKMVVSPVTDLKTTAQK